MELRAGIHPNSELVKALRVLVGLSRCFESSCTRSGLSLSKYRILMMMTEEPIRAAELASLTRVSPPTLSGLVGALARDGLVERLPSHMDRRSVLLIRTEAGRSATHRAEQCLAHELVSLSDRHGFGFDTLERVSEKLAEIYDRLVERWQAQDGPASFGLDPSASASDA